jgi:ABC-type nitrate/sulfonate/bicarbonate transport system ATPase subunit
MLQISALTKHYDDETGLQHLALEGINLAVGEQEAVALVGTSGCGKTTLLRIVSGLERVRRSAHHAGRLRRRPPA